MLNLRQIEVFRAVMITGSISGASKLLLVSQPAVSRMLSHTEQRVGFQLFERIRGRLYPAPEARRLFHDVEHVYRDIQRVNSTLQDLVQQRHGVVRIACSPSLGHRLVPDAIAAFRRSYPNTRVSLECVRHTILRDRMLDQQAELGISLFAVEHPNLETSPLFTGRLVCICPPEHPLAEQTVVSPEDLSQHNLIGYSAETPFGQLVRSVFAEKKSFLRAPIEVSSPHYACSLVRSGAGVALVDEFSLQGFLPGDVAVKALAGVSPLQVNIVHPGTEPLSQPARRFIEKLHAATLPDAKG